MTDHIEKLNKLRQYMALWIDGKLPWVQVAPHSDQWWPLGSQNYNSIEPMDFEYWLEFPYKTDEEKVMALIERAKKFWEDTTPSHKPAQ